MATETKKREKTAEEKAAFAEKMAKAREAKKQETEAQNEAKEEQNINADETETKESPAEKETETKGYTEEDVQRMIRIALVKQAEQLQRPQVIQVQANVEKVHFLWQAEVADDNVVTFGQGGMYGRITGKTGSFYVPKSDLSQILDERTRWMIDNRWLIVLSGLTDEERDAMNCRYKDGEILDKGAFSHLVEMGDKIYDIYPQLCPQHKIIVAQRYLESYEKGDKRVTRERVSKLNQISKRENEDLPDDNPMKRGAFATIIDKMNAQDAK
jgi:flagellar biosynthesis GTPase FlhF